MHGAQHCVTWHILGAEDDEQEDNFRGKETPRCMQPFIESWQEAGIEAELGLIVDCARWTCASPFISRGWNDNRHQGR